MSKDLIRIMHSLFLPAAGSCREALWHPAADIYRTRSGWLIKFDLAGVQPDALSVNLAGSRLTVRGTRRDWCLEEGCHYYQMEIAYNHFERSIDLPLEATPVGIATEYRDGMLLVRLQMEANS
jgi:HSP20 family protein